VFSWQLIRIDASYTQTEYKFSGFRVCFRLSLHQWQIIWGEKEAFAPGPKPVIHPVFLSLSDLIFCVLVPEQDQRALWQRQDFFLFVHLVLRYLPVVISCVYVNPSFCYVTMITLVHVQIGIFPKYRAIGILKELRGWRMVSYILSLTYANWKCSYSTWPTILKLFKIYFFTWGTRLIRLLVNVVRWLLNKLA